MKDVAAAVGVHPVHLARSFRARFRMTPGDYLRRAGTPVHPGELTTVLYEFQNIQNRTMAAQAIPSYAPKQAMAHFNKLECFCFNQYTLEPGVKNEWPVAFVIDPKLSRDVTNTTLSYTFFEVGGKTPAAPQSVSVKGLPSEGQGS